MAELGVHSPSPGDITIRTIRADQISPGGISPIALYERARWKGVGFLIEGMPGGWFDGRFSVIGGAPFAIFQSRGRLARFDFLDPGQAPCFSTGDPLEALQSWLDRFRLLPSPGGASAIPFLEGGAVGFFSYELARQFEKIDPPLQETPDLPDIYLPFFNLLLVVDHFEERVHLIYNPFPEIQVGKTGAAARRDGDKKIERLLRNLKTPLGKVSPAKVNRSPLQADLTREAYIRMVRQAKDYISAGDIFQANLSHRFKNLSPSASLFQVYRRLREINPSPFSIYLALGEIEIASGSPERLIRIKRENDRNIAETRPIAGTRPRGGNEREDKVLIRQLRRSEKERAEHLMLVDLERNDLGKICRYGTVRVDALMEIEKYSHLFHLVSNVRGELLPGTSPLQGLKALFPGGTITGVPKVRCMQIISELERHPRGIYTGSLGYLTFSGEIDLNIAIRTLVRNGGEISFHVGAGIVADSDPEAEYQETLQKAAALIKALQS